MTAKNSTVGCWVLFLIFASCGGFLGYETTRGWPPSEVRRLVNAACPPGTSRADVKAWLESNPFSEPNPATYDERLPSTFGGYCSDQEVNLRPQELSDSCIVKDVPHPNVDFFCRGEIEIFFYFDKQDKLVKAYVRVWVCSL